MFKNFSEETYENNRLLLSNNPLMSIALTADLLSKIALSRRRFLDKCTNLKKATLALGEVFNGKIEDEDKYEKLIMDVDFKGRSVLNIICYKGFSPLMSEEDPKAENIINNMWWGAQSTKCDGNITGYSNLYHILYSSFNNVTDENTLFMDIVTNFFVLNTKVDYSFQHRYRSMDISFYFKKDMIMGFFVLILQMYVIYYYDLNFRNV